MVKGKGGLKRQGFSRGEGEEEISTVKICSRVSSLAMYIYA